MTEETKAKWDAIYADKIALAEDAGAVQASYVLMQNFHLLPRQGRALEVACGRGGNAIQLARHGLQVDAWDISPVAISQLNEYAAENGLMINGQARDVMSEPPQEASYDVVIVCHFLERDLIPLLRKALKPGGLLFYQTFTQTCISNRGPSKAEYRLADNELLRLCEGLQVHYYREDGDVGELDQGVRDLAMIVARYLAGCKWL